MSPTTRLINPPSRLRRLAAGFIYAAIAVSALITAVLSFGAVKPFDHLTRQAWPDAGRDRASDLARRFLPLRQSLAHEPSVGFETDAPRDAGHHMMLQSIIAPTLVVESDSQSLLVASFTDEFELDVFIITRRLSVRERFGHGLALLQRPATNQPIASVKPTP